MKQRTRLMHGGDDLISYDMIKKTDGDANSEIQLHKMKVQEHYIEAQVQEGDTLQAIALRFYCSISELKRINQIHKDNEIFARRTIKVPVTPYSVLTELMPTAEPIPLEPVPSTSHYIPTTTSSIQGSTNNGQIAVENVQNKKNRTRDDFSIDCNAVVLNSTLTPSVIPYTDIEPNDSITEDTKLLPSKQKEPVEAVVVKQLTSQGADFGLKWFHVVCFMLVIGVVVPLVIVILSLEKHPIDSVDHQQIPPLGTSTR